MSAPQQRGISWRRRIALGVAVWFLLCAGGLGLHAHPRPALLALAVAATGGVLLLALDVSGQTPPVGWVLRADEPALARGEDARLALLLRLVNSHLDARMPSTQLRGHLVDLLDRRLVAHHGISRLADPERASALMTPELAAFAAAGPPYPRMTLAQIARLTDQIEEL